MTPLYRSECLILLIVVGVSSFVFGQNLVPNPSFEIYSTCPTGFGSGGPLQAVPWQSGSLGSADYFNECTSSNLVDVPDNFFGSQPAFTGAAYGGGYFRYAIFEYREYLQVQLITPLVGGSYYNISFYASCAGKYCGVSHMGVYFSQTPPPYTNWLLFNVTPQFEAALGYISDTTNWVLIEGCYLAQGGEQWITIGNFYNDAQTPVDPNCPNAVNTAYYYIDEVSLTLGSAPETIDFELGGPVTACYEYTIDPGIPDVNYTWDDGSHDPTLTVTETGVYSLTVSNGCSFGVDSIEVTILGVEPVDAGPPTATICQGDTYTVSLDPDLGDYVWDDGSTDPEYDITESGIYTVSLDDGCQVTSDMVEVFVIDPPAPFSLGADTFLCPSGEIPLSLNPALGDFEWSDGSMEPDFTIDEEGTYSLTISNMCGEESDEINVILIQPPYVELGPDEAFICDGDVIDIELDPDQGDYLWQDGSTSNTYSITAPGNYHVSSTNECGISEDDLIVILIPAPALDLGDDITLCPQQLPVTLDASMSGGTAFIWNDDSTGDQYEVTEAGIYSVTVTNACGTVSDFITVTVEDGAPEVILPEDQVLCPGETLLLFNDGATGTYLWQDLSSGNTFLVTQPGTYALTVTTACGSGNDSIVVQYQNPLTTPDLGPDFSLCPGETAVLQPDLTGVNFLWQDGSTADSLLISSAGLFYVQVADQCTTASDTVIVTLNANPPQVDLPLSLTLCQGSTLSIDAGINGVTYLWSDGSASSSLLVTGPGTYSLTVTNSCGADRDTVTVVDGGPSPAVELGNNVQFCAGDTVHLVPAFSDVITWLWHDGSTMSSQVITQPGEISVQVSNACGTSFDTLQASLLPAIPSLSLGPDTSLCPGEQLILTIPILNVQFLWSDGSQGNQLTIQNPGTYAATISNACGQQADSLLVNSLPPAPLLDLGADQSLCPGETFTVDPGIPGVSYLWQDGSTGLVYSTTQPEQIILTVSNACGSATDTLDIVVSTDGPQLDLGPDIIGCSGDVITIPAGISGVNYLWQDGSTGNSFTTAASVTLILAVSNNCGADSDTLIVDLSALSPSVDLGPDTLLCDGASIVLLANTTPATNVAWQDGSVSSSYLVSAPGIYSLLASNFCGDDSDSILVTYQSPPAPFSLGPDTVLCPGEQIILQAPLTNDALQWQDGSSGSTLPALVAQTYSLQVSNRCGAYTDALVLTFDDHDPLVVLDSLLSWCPGNTILLDVAQPFPAAYTWNTGATASAIQVVTPGIYTVTVETLCFTHDAGVEVVEATDCFPKASFFVPNVISPNGDQVNDVFRLESNNGTEITTVQGSIFDRWGNLVYSHAGDSFEWDGKFTNEPVNPGVYVYRVAVAYRVQGQLRTVILSGDVTLIR